MARRPLQYCPVARTLDLIGDRWSMLILRDLLLDGARKFQDLHDSLEGVSPNTLSDRLKKLMQNGIIDAQVQRLRTDTSQKRLVEKRGTSTMVPPIHMVASVE